MLASSILILCTLFALIAAGSRPARRRAEQELRQSRDELDAKVFGTDRRLTAKRDLFG